MDESKKIREKLNQLNCAHHGSYEKEVRIRIVPPCSTVILEWPDTQGGAKPFESEPSSFSVHCFPSSWRSLCTSKHLCISGSWTLLGMQPMAELKRFDNEQDAWYRMNANVSYTWCCWQWMYRIWLDLVVFEHRHPLQISSIRVAFNSSESWPAGPT